MPLVCTLLLKKKFCTLSASTIVQQLMGMNIANIACMMASRDLPFAGRLKHFQNNWQCITNDPWVLDAISGLRIDFLQRPWQTNRPAELTFSEKDTESLLTEINGMQSKQAISETPQGDRGFYSQLFLVPKKDGNQRPVINLKKLNSFVRTEHFKMEGIHMLKNLLRPGDWMAKVDLKDAYFMIPIAQEDRSFLCFSWGGVNYQFNCLPFGLSSAPWVFTKTTRPVVATLSCA